MASKKPEVRKVIEAELLDREEQALYAAELALLRAEVQHIQAHASALNGMIRCGSAFMKPERIRREILELQATLEKALARQSVLQYCAKHCA